MCFAFGHPHRGNCEAMSLTTYVLTGMWDGNENGRIFFNPRMIAPLVLTQRLRIYFYTCYIDEHCIKKTTMLAETDCELDYAHVHQIKCHAYGNRLRIGLRAWASEYMQHSGQGWPWKLDGVTSILVDKFVLWFHMQRHCDVHSKKTSR